MDTLTDRLLADTDGDGINDGDELSGKFGYITEPTLADTDGDWIRDLLEIQTGTNPTVPNNLAAALQSLSVSPLLSALVVSTTAETSEQLAVMGLLRDGTTIDLTSTTRGTNYGSSDPTRCNFSSESGQVFATAAGVCIVTATNSGFSAAARIFVSPAGTGAVDAAGVPPGVTIAAPRIGDVAVEGVSLAVRVDASDDVAVAGIQVLVDGTVVFATIGPRARFTLAIPVGVSSLTIGAQAIDFGNNVSTAADVVVDVVPDARTTALGRVVDGAGNPIEAATVTCLGVATQRGADGGFAILGLPTVQGLIQCTVSFLMRMARCWLASH